MKRILALGKLGLAGGSITFLYIAAWFLAGVILQIVRVLS